MYLAFNLRRRAAIILISCSFWENLKNLYVGAPSPTKILDTSLCFFREFWASTNSKENPGSALIGHNVGLEYIKLWKHDLYLSFYQAFMKFSTVCGQRSNLPSQCSVVVVCLFVYRQFQIFLVS